MHYHQPVLLAEDRLDGVLLLDPLHAMTRLGSEGVVDNLAYACCFERRRQVLRPHHFAFVKLLGVGRGAMHVAPTAALNSRREGGRIVEVAPAHLHALRDQRLQRRLRRVPGEHTQPRGRTPRVKHPLKREHACAARRTND